MLKHQWREVIAPRVYGGDTEVKHALQCQVCKKSLILAERDFKYMLDGPCPGEGREMTAKEWAWQAMRRHYQFDPVEADWAPDPETGNVGMGLCIEDTIRAAVEEEREACAKALEDEATHLGEHGFAWIGERFWQAAGIIRARATPAQTPPAPSGTFPAK